MIATDLDGVLADTYSLTRIELLKIYGMDINDYPKKGCKRFKIKLPHVSEKNISLAIYKVIADYWEDIQPYPDVEEALRKLYDFYKKPIEVVTARKFKEGNGTIKSTYLWLKKIWTDIEFEVSFTGHNEKAELLKEKGCKVFIEDRFKNANVISDYVEKVYLVNRVWNIGRKESTGVERVDSFNEAVNKIVDKEE